MRNFAPNGTNPYKESFYRNSAVTGNKVVASQDISWAADAAVMLGMKHLEICSAVYALSPCCLAMEADMSEANSAWTGVLQLTSKDQLSRPPRSFGGFYHSAFIALAAAFSPNPNRAPFFVDLPFER